MLKWIVPLCEKWKWQKQRSPVSSSMVAILWNYLESVLCASTLQVCWKTLLNLNVAVDVFPSCVTSADCTRWDNGTQLFVESAGWASKVHPRRTYQSAVRLNGCKMNVDWCAATQHLKRGERRLINSIEVQSIVVVAPQTETLSPSLDMFKLWPKIYLAKQGLAHLLWRLVYKLPKWFKCVFWKPNILSRNRWTLNPFILNERGGCKNAPFLKNEI